MGVRNIYERFVWFDGQARSNCYPNASSLSRKFETSVKTGQRDIEFMRDRLQCPLEYDVRRKGYYYEDNTFSLPMVYLSSEELSSLLIAKKLLQDVSGGLISSEISSLLEKIMNILKRHTVVADQIDDAFSFQLIGYSPAPEEVFKTILEGCLRRKRLSFTYFSPVREERSIREVDPYHLFNYMGTWHLIGHCFLRETIRDFVLGRITDAKVLDETFEIPPGFNMRDYFHSSFGIYKGGALKKVTLRFLPEKAKWIRDQIWHREQKARFLKDGSLELSFPVADFSEIKMEILKHGDKVEVIRPKSLRDLIRSEAENIVSIY